MRINARAGRNAVDAAFMLVFRNMVRLKLALGRIDQMHLEKLA